MTPSRRSLFIVLILAAITGCTLPTPTITPTSTPAPIKGAPGMDDPYFPGLGNGGYDVQTYTIALDVDPSANTVSGSTTIMANAAERLSTFNLDFHGLTIDAVNVNDAAAKYSRFENELTITPSTSLEPDKPFTVVVKYNGTPELVQSTSIGIQMGWSHADSGAVNVWGEPDAASSWFPNNNHPRDKATYRFEITVPQPWLVAATGTLKETKETGDKTTFVWEMDQPMTTYLASINIDQYELVTQTGPNGMVIRNYFPAGFPSSSRSSYDIIPEAIEFFTPLFGSYPFDEYGVVVAAEDGLCAKTSLALEAQSLSIHCPVMSAEAVIVHELAHQWFGDSVSLENWKDIWLKEGFASYAEWLWASKNDPVALARIVKNREGMFFDSDFPVAEPSPENLYTNDSYTGGALVLHALRLQVGEDAFFKILQTYAERYRYKNAGTDEFMMLAEEVSGQDLDSFSRQWLYSKRLPDMPEQ